MLANLRESLKGGKAARMKVGPTWWDAAGEDEELAKVLQPIYAQVGRGALQNIADTLDKIVMKGATRSVIADLLESGGQRIKGINDVTLQGITIELAEGTRRGYSIPQLIDGVPDEGYRGIANLTGFSDIRAETIARTETMLSYNRATVNGYAEFGITHLLAYDGDDDPECAERNGQEFTIEEAAAIEDHPNGTLVWSPVVGDAAATEGTPGDESARIREQEAAEIAANQALDRAFNAAAAQEQRQAADEAARVLASGQVKPVSAAFDDVINLVQSNRLAMMDTQYVKVVDKIKSALATIDKTFRDGSLPPMPRIGPIKGGNGSIQGMYRHRLDGVPEALEFRANAHMETVFHEIAHFFDQHALGGRGGFGSDWGMAKLRGRLDGLVARTFNDEQIALIRSRAEVMEPVMRSITESRGYLTLERALATGRIDYVSETGQAAVLNVDRRLGKWVSYATQANESFARAMGQYLAKRHGDDAIRQIEERLYAGSVSGPYGRVLNPLADQWEWDDFKAIDQAITKMFRDLGWYVE